MTLKLEREFERPALCEADRSKLSKAIERALKTTPSEVQHETNLDAEGLIAFFEGGYSQEFSDLVDEYISRRLTPEQEVLFAQRIQRDGQLQKIVLEGMLFARTLNREHTCPNSLTAQDIEDVQDYVYGRMFDDARDDFEARAMDNSVLYLEMRYMKVLKRALEPHKGRSSDFEMDHE